jgi:hypothetical protein
MYDNTLASEYRPRIQTQVGRIIRRFGKKGPGYEGESAINRLEDFYKSQLPPLLKQHETLQLSSGDVIQRAGIIKNIILDSVPAEIHDEVSKRLSEIERAYSPKRKFTSGVFGHGLTAFDDMRILGEMSGKRNKRK